MATTKKTTTSRTASSSKKTASSGGSSKTARANGSANETAARTAKRTSAPRASARKKPSGIAVAGEAARQLLELTGREVEGVTGLERSDHGWKVQVEVVEVRRIPDTTDVLALYELDVDEDGDLEGYRRLRRYARGVPGED